MEDDDEFGDLYTDVLTASFQSQQQPPPAPAPQDEAAAPRAAAGAGPTTRPIDLNINSDDEEILYGAPNPSSNPNFTAPNSVITDNVKTLAPLQDVQSGSKLPEFNLNFNKKAGKLENLSEINESDLSVRVLEKSEDVKLPKVGFQDSNFMDEDNIDFVVEERDDKDDILIEKDQNLGEKNAENLKDGSGNVESFEPLIPGVSIPGVSGGGGNGGDGNLEDDWDSDDSEDDLQIVLNDNTHGPMGMERMGDDEDDEDGEPLVIVADNDGPSHPPMIMEEQEWGEEGGPAVNGERKEINDALKVNGAPGGVAAKVAYNNHGYHHPYHSQYKYVRPGAAPMPGAPPLLGPGGAPGQVRPPVNVGPVGGRGRGDWRPTGMKGGYGMSGWGGSAPGRGFGIGLEFTLPTHKTIFEVDIDGFEEKPWRLPGIDVTDFFNFGLNEESWKDYCKQLEQLRLESTMQGRIRVYESGRTEQEYDPDLPPELAAAAGIQDIPSENVNHGKTDGTSSDLARGSIRMRPPLPTGRPIQVETGSGDRLPSIDTRPPRQRDSDAIIEIVCQDEDQDSGNDKNEVQLGNNSSIEDFRGDARGSPLQEDSDGFQHSYKSHKQDLSTRRSQFMNPVGDHLTKGDGVGPFPSEAPGQFVSGSRGQTSAHGSKTNVVQHEEREKKGSAHEGSPDISPSGDSRDRLQVDNQREESFESIDHRHSPVPPSPTTDRPAQEQYMEDRDDIRDQPVGADTNSEAEREEMALDARADSEAMNDEFLHSKKQNLSSRREKSSPQETDGGEDSKAGRSSENSKAQSGSSRDYRKLRDDVEEEVVQDGRPMRMDNAKKAVARDEDRGRRRAYNEKEAEKHRGVVKGREDSYSRKGIDSSSAHYIDRRREREYSEAVWQRRDEDLPGRRTKVEEPRKRELIDETGSRHRSKVREFDGSDREERHLHRKQLESITLRPDYDKDMGARQRDRDELKRYDTLDDRHNKRRKEETKLSREHADKEESFHPHGENMVRRKRERDDTSDHRKRDELLRLRDDEQHYIRHKEDGVFQRERTDRQREREEWYRLKQSQEEALSKREREEIRGGMRAGRVAEEKAWAGHSRGKDENRNSDQHLKDVRHADHIRRRDRAENESPSRLRTREDERRARPDRVSAREDRAPHAPDNSRVNEKRHKEYLKKGKEFEGDHNSQIASNMNEDELNGRRNEMMSLKRKFEQGTNENKVHRNRQSSRKQQEEASSDDEQQDSKKGRSKLERWTSHKERDFSIDAKSSSLNMKDNDVHKSSGTSLANKNPDEALKAVEDNQQPAANNKNGGGPEINNVEAKHMEDKHLETVEKLKKRSERFKLPMPSEKEAPVSKKAEGDPISSVQSEIPPDSEVKPERPARRRRWTSN